MKFRFYKLFSTCAILIIVAFAFAACTKPPTEGHIKVVDLATGDAVPGATVRLFIQSPPAAAGAGFTTKEEGFITEKTLTADGSGNCTVNLTLEATLSIEAKSGAKSGTGVIACQRYKSTDVVVKIK